MNVDRQHWIHPVDRSVVDPVGTSTLTVKRGLASLLSVLLVVTSLVTNIVQAQTLASDFEAPIIEHDVVEAGVLGDAESFVATVIDNLELENVSLFFRFSGDEKFTEIPMRPLAESAYFSATVDTSTEPANTVSIEYYIRAEDTAGNVVLKGFTFEPLVRTLAQPEGSVIDDPLAITSPAAQDPAPASPAPEAKRGINWLWVGLGVLVAGGLAAAASGGGDSGWLISTHSGVAWQNRRPSLASGYRTNLIDPVILSVNTYLTIITP